VKLRGANHFGWVLFTCQLLQENAEGVMGASTENRRVHRLRSNILELARFTEAIFMRRRN